MAKYQDTVEILIQARDEARRELRGIRGEVAKTRDELGGQAGVVASAAKLHHALQKVSTAADSIKTGMAATRGIMKGLEGDSDGMVESFKQMGFGIGEVVNQADQLADLLANRIHGVTEEMLEAEKSRNAEHQQLVKLQQIQAANAEKARDALSQRISDQSRELQLLSAVSDKERERLEANRRLNDAFARAQKLREIANKDNSEANRERANALADRVTINSQLIEQRKAEIREEKAKTAEMEKQNELAKQRQEAERAFINSAVARVRDIAVNAMRGQLDELREEARSIQTRGSTVSLGSQSGRFVTGMRDRMARREDEMLRQQQETKATIERKAEEIKQALDRFVKKLDSGGTRLIPLNISAGGAF